MKECNTDKIEREDFQGERFSEIMERFSLRQTILTSNDEETWKRKNAVLLNNLPGSTEWSTPTFIVGSRLNDCSILKLCFK
jgi:hypothetical protein